MSIAIVTLIILILINAFFAASELAFVNLNENKVKRQAELGDKKALKIYQLISNSSHFLSTIQIGITLAGFLSSAFAADFFAGPLSELLFDLGVPIPLGTLNTISVVVITIVLSYFTLVFGELVPKQLALKKADEIARVAVGPISLLAKICSPIVKFLTFSIHLILRLLRVDPNDVSELTTEEDIRLMIDMSGESGTINKNEQTMLDNVFEFDDKLVSDIMTHRTEFIALSYDLDFRQVIQQINQYRFTRFPVYQESKDNIIGVLHVKDLFEYISKPIDEPFSLVDAMREPFFVLESQPIDVVFANMRNNNIHIAIILDEYGGTEGLITIEDIIEEIVGEISSESIEPGHLNEEIDQVSLNQFRVDGTFRLWELQDELNVELPIDEFETVSGFVINQIGYLPKEDEQLTIRYNQLVFEVKKVVEKRIDEVIVTIEDQDIKETDSTNEE